VDKQLIDCSHHENWGSFQLNCHIVSLILFPDDRKTRQTWLLVSAEFSFDLRFFFNFRKDFFSRPRFLHFCKVYETHQTSLRKTCLLLLFPIFVSWFHQHIKDLSWQHQVKTHATHHLQSDPSWISLQVNHLNSFNHCIWKRHFWKPVCATRKSYEDKGVQLFNNKVL